MSTTKSTTSKGVATSNTTNGATTKKASTSECKKVEHKQLPLDTMVACTNMTSGKLIYISTRQMGFTIEWEHEGDVEYIELGELVTMRNSQRAFFEKNWIAIEDPEVKKFLRVNAYYDGIPSIDDYEDLFNKPDSEILEILKGVPDGFKEILANKASKMISDGTIDSRKTIALLKSELNLDIEE